MRDNHPLDPLLMSLDRALRSGFRGVAGRGLARGVSPLIRPAPLWDGRAGSAAV
jgi:hypothetical protein